nr:S8 family serine peptidase [Rhizobium halophytocola]
MQDFNTFASSKSARHFPVQQALVQLNAVAAQRISKGANVKVAIVDSAIDGTHPDLSGRVEALRDFVDDDRQGKGEAHGTAIAGIIGADATNATGMVGVAPDAELVGLRACWQAKGKAGHCNSFSLARALNFAILNHFDVINMSLGGPPDLLLGELIHAAIDSGAVVVAAWGEGDKAAFPASVPGVIAAGRSADTAIPAPSVDVLSTAPHNHYNYVSGSSVAAAHVSGVVALLLAAHPGLHANDVAKTLHAAVEARHGKPMLDACQALDAVVDKPFSCTQ